MAAIQTLRSGAAPRCAECGRRGTRIVYGELRGALAQAAREGRIVAGGSIHRAATHRCPLAHEWVSVGKAA